MPMYYQTPDQHPLAVMRFWQQQLAREQWEREERRRIDRQRTQRAAPDRRRTAEHEAAHAIASVAMGGRVGEIAITGDGGYFRAAVSQRPPRDTEVETAAMRYLLDGLKRDGSRPESLFRHMVVDLTPYAREVVLGLPNCRETCSIDLERARMQAEALSSSGEEASRLWDRPFARATEIVTRHRREIEVLGDELARRGHMSGDEIRRTLADAGFQPVTISAGLRYRQGVLVPQPQQRCPPARREIYAGGVRIGWIEPLHDDDGSELGFVAYRSDGELVGWGADSVSAAQAL
jgi:hypothetical protein